MLVVNSILIGLVVMLIITSLLERHHNRRSMNIKEEQIMSLTKMIVDQNDITTKLTTEVDNTVKTSAKLLGIINKMNSGLKKSIKDIDHDMTGMIEMIKVLTKAQQDGMKAHNDLVNYTVEEIGKIWCDLCEEECEYCPFEDTCKNWDPMGGGTPSLAVDSDNLPQQCEPDHPAEYVVKSDYNERGCAGSMTINPEDPEQLDKLIDKMKSTGMPDEVLRQYKAAIEEAIKRNPNHPEKIDIIWKSEPITQTRTSRKRVTNPIKEEKLIDPNSKIVKSLDKLYKESK